MKKLLLIALLALSASIQGQENKDPEYFDLNASTQAYSDLYKWKEKVNNSGDVLDVSIDFDTNVQTGYVWDAYFYTKKKSYIKNKNGKLKKVVEMYEGKRTYGKSSQDNLLAQFSRVVERGFNFFKEPYKQATDTVLIDGNGVKHDVKKIYKWKTIYHDKPAWYKAALIIKVTPIYKRGKLKGTKRTSFFMTEISPRYKVQIKENLKDDEIGSYLGGTIYALKGSINAKTMLDLTLIDVNNPKSFIDGFISLAKDYNIDLNINDNIKTTFTGLHSGIIALALGKNNDCEINIAIDLSQWEAASNIEKLLIIYHELGHDILNLEHSDGIRLMTTTKQDDPKWYYVGSLIHEMFERVSNDYTLKNRIKECKQ